jgi:Fuc2NAc and GlcNAc transferase
MTSWWALAIMAALVFAASTVLTGRVRRYALDRNLLDTANERSSHTIPTPRGGGLAIVLAVLAGLAASTALTELPLGAAAAFIGGGALVAWIGWVDDHGHVAPLVRLAGHLAASLWAVAWLGPLSPAFLGLPAAAAGIVAWPLSILIVAWMLNLFNFMDGIDGIAGSEAVLVAGGGFIILLFTTVGTGAGIATPFLLLTAGAAGFLVWNWPPARIFMGDAGSGFVGYSLGCLILAANALSAEAAAAMLILPGVFVADATVTLLHRLARRERVFQAHRSHAYQRLARKRGSHRPVTLAAIGLTAVFLFPLAWLVAARLLDPLAGLLAAYVPLCVGAWLSGAGRPLD